MRILVFEDNLMWSARLLRSIKALGHEPVLCSAEPADVGGACAAIVNLGSVKTAASELIASLHALGLHVIGHAGHKESELLAFGRDAGCDQLVTNSELTYKIESILARIQPPNGAVVE